MKMEPKEILSRYYNYAVIGVSQNKDKFGYKIFKRLINKGYNVYGITPLYQEVDGIPLYSKLEKVEQPIDVVVFVIKKDYAYDYVEEMTELGIRYAWMQPDTYDDKLIEYIESVGIIPIKACILVETSL